MQPWNRLLSAGSITLAADARFSQVDYCDDHIWELKVSEGIPTVIGLTTSFGLRARRFVLFPQFTEDNHSITDPSEFFQPPLVSFAYPNFARLVCQPFEGIAVELDYWVPESHAVWGRIQVTNASALTRQLQLAWVAVLIPLEVNSSSGSRMAVTKIQYAPVLWGKTSMLSPLVCLRGESAIGNVPYPSLYQTIELLPGAVKELFWAEAACSDLQDSFNLARSYLNRNWEAEFARLMLSNSTWIDIQCGDPDWNAAFALSQQIGLSLFSSTVEHSEKSIAENATLPFPSLLLTRSQHQGYSIRGDGSDYGYAWSGQGVLDVYYAASLLLPVAPHLFQGLLLNYFSVQNTSTGAIDCRPGLSGQRSRMLATPLLAALTWKIYQYTRDKEFLARSVEPLRGYLQAWFSDHDEDVDGAPEWEHPLQFGFADHPLFSRLIAGAQGALMNAVESPALCALLIHEIKSMLSICEELSLPEPLLQGRGAVKHVRFSELAEMLKLTLRTFWNAEKRLFLYRDRDAHTQTDGYWLGERVGNGILELNYSFPSAARLVLRLETEGDRSQRPKVSIEGKDAQGNSICEVLPLSQWRWVLLKIGQATTAVSYTQVERIEVQNIGDEDKFSVSSLGYSFIDLSLFLPLWGDLITPEQAAALKTRLFDEQEGLFYPYGLGEYPKNWQDNFPLLRSRFAAPPSSISTNISMVWSTLLGEGLLEHGYSAECVALVTRIMNCVTQSLKKWGAFFELYDAFSGEGKGEMNSLRGLAPLGLFLQTLGVTLYSPWKIGLAGYNPFPWQVTIAYRGLTILRDAQQTWITFPNGQTVCVDDPTPAIIAVEDEE